MPELWLIKDYNNIFKPSHDEDLEISKKIKRETPVKAKVWKERNYKFHKKYFALLKIAFENQSIYSTMKEFRNELKFKTGCYTIHKTTKNVKLFIPDSISFENMDEIEFEKHYQKAIDAILEHFLPDIEKDVKESEKILRRYVEEIVGFS